MRTVLASLGIAFLVALGTAAVRPTASDVRYITVSAGTVMTVGQVSQGVANCEDQNQEPVDCGNIHWFSTGPIDVSAPTNGQPQVVTITATDVGVGTVFARSSSARSNTVTITVNP